MTTVERVRVVARRVTNAVGAGYVTGAEACPEAPIPVVAQISWDGGPREPVAAMCVAWTRDYVKVHVRDSTVSLSFDVWLRPADVARVEE